MQAIIYIICFALVAIPTVYGYAVWLLHLGHISIPYSTLLSLGLLSYGFVVPKMFMGVIPVYVLIAVGYLQLFLLVRRIWLFIAKKDYVPASFKGVPKVLGYVGVFFYVAAFIVLGLSILFHAGSGVPAGMLMMPAMLCIPWAFFLTEVFSLRIRNAKPAEAPPFS